VNDDTVFLYLHIPKTGGSTLGDMLYRYYHDGSQRKEEGGYFRSGLYYLPDGFIRASGESELTQRDLQAATRPDTTAVLGHFAFGIHEQLDRPARYMTLLRDPVQRVLSLYHHLRQYDQLPAGLTIEAFVAGPHIHEACNDQVRRLAGMRRGEPCDASTLAAALKNAEHRIDLVGVTERFDASLLLAQQTFGWKGDITYLPRLVNTTRKKRRDEAPELIALIEQHNALDLELYRFANAMLDRRIAQQGDAFEQELAAFTQKNQAILAKHGPSSTVS
jgi:hypothetical protein